MWAESGGLPPAGTACSCPAHSPPPNPGLSRCSGPFCVVTSLDPCGQGALVPRPVWRTELFERSQPWVQVDASSSSPGCKVALTA